MSRIRPSRVVVVGGGIAGLASAHRLVELSRERGSALELALLEARERLGGTIATERSEGFLIEAGPDSFLSEKPWALALCQRLGITDRLVGTDDRFRKTFVVHGGRLHPLPDGFQLLAPTRLMPLVVSPLFSCFGKLRMGLDLILPRGGSGDDESLGSFVRRRLGCEALERVAQPLVAGIYAGDPDQLSLAATMPRFLEMEQRHRSLILALWKASRSAPEQAKGASGARWSLFVTFAEGMEELVRVLSERLPHGSIRLKQEALAVQRENGRWFVRLSDGGVIEADGVILAPPAYRSASVIRSADPALARLLEAIPYAPSATVSLAYRRSDIPHPLDGFGFVVPRSEGRPILACTFSSVKYPGRAPEGFVLLRLFVGGALNEAALQEDDEALVALCRAQLAELLGVMAPPCLSRLHRFVAAMPQYQVRHLERVAAIERRLAEHPGLRLAGSAYRGVGIADCVRAGEEAAIWTLRDLG
ncbi:MAG: protoporphyrinogen oxidase [Candidatus Methylomirabilia bacterium]